MTEEEKQEAAALEEGLARAFQRLDMTFESPEAYLDFWFPDQNLKMEDLPPDLADYYLYDLGEVDGGYNPKASRAAAEEDSPSVSSTSPTAEEMSGVGCPVALVQGLAGLLPRQRPAHLGRGARRDGRTARHPHGDIARRRESLHDAVARVH